MKVQYVGDSDARIINKSDWPDDAPADRVEWSSDKGMVQDLPNKTAEWLLSTHGEEFKAVSEK